MAKYTYNPPYNQWSGNRSDTLNKWKINYKGSIATASALPDEGEFKGDTYNVLEDGSNYMWNGTSWDKLDANIYIGATSVKDGVQGLVPPASNSQVYSLLTGGGTWESAEALGLALDDEVVHLTGDETIEGVKTFQSNYSSVSSSIIIKSTDIVKGTASFDHNTGIVFVDSTDNDPDNDGRLASIVYHSPATENSDYYTHLRCNNYYGSGDSVLRVGYDGNNIPYSTAPATSDDRTNSTDIVTRGYMEASEWNWQKTKKNVLVQFKPAPESDLEPVVDFMFTETLPAEGEKGPENPSTITGVSSVKVTRCGKNLLKFLNYSSNTINGVTCSADLDGTITLDGTASGGASFQQYFNPKVKLDNDTAVFCSYEIVSGTFTPPTSQQIAFVVQDIATKTGSNSVYLGINNTNVNGIQKTVPAGYAFAGSNVIAYSGASFDNLKLKVQLEFGGSETTWESPVFSDYTIQLGDTYYGGSLDVATGVMTVNYQGLVFDGTENWVPHPSIAGCYQLQLVKQSTNAGNTIFCTHYDVKTSLSTVGFYISANYCYFYTEYATATDLKSFLAAQSLAGTPVVVVYKLLSPYTVQLTPTQIRSLPALDKYEPRVNTVYTDQEAVQVGYQKFFDENRLASIETRLEALEASQG